MKCLSQRLAATLLLGPWLAPCSTSLGGEVHLNGRVFQLPDGFELEVAAGPELAERPITASFDELGRLYVADSSGSNDPVQKQLEEKPHRILRLEDTDGDGRFDRRIEFADRMMFPEGTLWFEGSLYVAAPPSIWKLTDTDGDGVADKREEWFEGKTLTGCANDLHGPYEGPDGYIYWCKGAFAEQTYLRDGKPPFVTRASHIFRRHPSGGEVEPVMTGGMDNPVDVVFTPGGEPIFTCTFLQHPADGKRDGLIHAVYGGVYGKVHDVIEGHPRTRRDMMPPLAHLGPAAPAGLLRYDSAGFGPSYRDNLFAALFNLHKVTRHELTTSGATFQSHDTDFLVGQEQDFHPTDVIEDADGSLLVVDTGGWYKLCCPTSQLWKPDVLGAIYRVRKTGAKPIQDPRGLKLDWQDSEATELVRRLADDRPAVRQRASRSLAHLGARALPALQQEIETGESASQRREAVWTTCRIAGELARVTTRLGLHDQDEAVRQAALHGVSLYRDASALSQVRKLLNGSSLQNQRAAAEVVGRIGDSQVVPELLELLTSVEDDTVEHALTYALIEVGDPEATAKGLEAATAKTRRAALVALDQIAGSQLKPVQVEPFLSSSDPLLREAANWIVERHPTWGDDLAPFLARQLSQAENLSEPQKQELVNLLSRLSDSKAVQQILAHQIESPSSEKAARISLETMRRTQLAETPPAWTKALARRCENPGDQLFAEAVKTLRQLPGGNQPDPQLTEILTRVGSDHSLPALTRLEALASIPGKPEVSDPVVIELLKDQLSLDQPVANRLAASDVVAGLSWRGQSFKELLALLREAGPLELDKMLSGIETPAKSQVASQLLEALEQAQARASLRPDRVRALFEDQDSTITDRAQRLVESLSTDVAKQREKIEELIATMPSGDIRRGQAVFNGVKGACSTCHAIGYLGGKVGPDLTRIGQVRVERDLLEAIVAPSASFVRSYEPVLVATQEGQVYNGILKNESAQDVTLAINATEEKRILRQDIEELSPGQVSVMPAGLDQQLTRQDLADLVAFLKSCR